MPDQIRGSSPLFARGGNGGLRLQWVEGRHDRACFPFNFLSYTVGSRILRDILIGWIQSGLDSDDSRVNRMDSMLSGIRLNLRRLLS